MKRQIYDKYKTLFNLLSVETLNLDFNFFLSIRNETFSISILA